MAVVILTLLIIEMVGFPLGWGNDSIGVDLPKVNCPVKMRCANREDALIVAIFRDGSVYFDNDRVNARDLPARLRERISHGAETKVYLKADARARYSNVVPVLNGVRAAGVVSIGILVDERRTHPAAQ